ncbi:MAG: radical SAM protein [Pseudomonadota bacterium]
MDLQKPYENCRLCPRHCGVNRLEESKTSRSGFCRENHHLRVAHVGPHFGEEPPITGVKGSGTIFFSGCSLKCSFCQNYQISRDGIGRDVNIHELLEMAIRMIHKDQVHNINLVTPDHFFPHAFELVSLLRQKGYDLPVVYNLSGYQSLSLLRIAEAYADIYLPDLKYGDPSLAGKLSRCPDYTKVALEAISEMVRQKGFLDNGEDNASPATRGVLVRHLILPGKIENSSKALTMLFLEFGPDLPLSLMSQYSPVLPLEDEDLNRTLRRGEFDRVFSHALDLGFEHLFVQYPDDGPTNPTNLSPLLPDFRLPDPFSGKKSCPSSLR